MTISACLRPATYGILDAQSNPSSISTITMFRLAALRTAAASSSRRSAAAVFRAPRVAHVRWNSVRATTPDQPRPSHNSPTPAGLESVFGGGVGNKNPPPPGLKPAGSPSEPHREPAVPGEQGKEAEEDDEGGEWKNRRPRLSDEMPKKKAATFGGGGGGGGGGSGGSGGGKPGSGPPNMTPNHLILIALS